MTDEEKGDFVKMEDPKMAESKGSNLKLILITVGILLIIVAIAIILLIRFNRDSSETKEGKKANNWDDSYKKADDFISKLNLTERISLLYGTENMKYLFPPTLKDESERRHLCVGKLDPFKKDDIDFKGMCIQDGPAGVRYANGTGMSWHAPINTAATFNRKLMYEVGKAQGEENKEKGINTVLSPSVNIMRTPQAGRTWEGFGEDPYYSGVCASEIIKGMQDHGVIATIKHFIGNDQETYRHSSSSNIEMNALMDIYAEPFYRPIHEAKVGSMMAAFNAFNNTYCSENKFLLTDILRGILDFKGFVMSDWWSVYSNHPDTFNSGLDVNMPGGRFCGPFDVEHMYDNVGRGNSHWSALEDYVKNKIVEEKRVNESARRIIASMYQMDQMESFPEVDLYRNTITDERKNLQRKVATESQVLLKNDGILPLKNIKKIAVVGNDAMERDCGIEGELDCKNDTNLVVNGNVPLGYGSGTTKFSYLVTPLQGIKDLAEKNNISVVSSGKLIYTDEKRGDKIVHVSAVEDIETGVAVSKDADVVIVFGKATSGEEYDVVENTIGDRLDLDLWHGANELIENITEVNKNVIVVINAPPVVNLPWLNKVRAVLFSGFPGAETGHAIADILFGVVNPSGHLPFTWAELDQYCTKLNFLGNLTVIDEKTGKIWRDEYRYDGVDSAGIKDDRENHEMEQYNYTEGLYVGQRWFNKYNKKYIFPFGYGLSYSSFNYSDLKLSMSKEGLKAEFNVKNTSPNLGQAVPMMFLTFPDIIGDYPEHIFKGFDKVELKPDETKKVTILADDHALSYFNVPKNNYTRINEGIIKVYIAENGNLSETKLMGEINANYMQ